MGPGPANGLAVPWRDFANATLERTALPVATGLVAGEPPAWRRGDREWRFPARFAGNRLMVRRACAVGRLRCGLLLGLSTLLPIVAPAAPPPLPPPNVEALMEIRSYGERPRDLLALIVPLLGQRQFAPDSRRRAEAKPEGSETFTHAGGDFVVTAGRYNCIVVAYFTGGGRGTAIRRGARERAEAFRLALWDFLDALPTPRPTIREIVWGSRYCSDGG